MNHFYYEKLNIYFPIQYKNNMEKHIDDILILTSFKGYEFIITKAITIHRFASIVINNYTFLFDFNYYDNQEENFKFKTMNVYHMENSKSENSKSEIILHNLSFIKKLEKIKELL